MTDEERDAVQCHFDHEMRSVGWCQGFPAPGSIGKLAAKGIHLESVYVLFECLRNVGMSYDFQFSKEAMEREQKIADLARELAKALSETPDAGRWRVVHDLEESTGTLGAVDVEELLETLDTLETGARQQVEQFEYAVKIGVRPGSGRAPTSRYFYWLSLLAFWRYGMSREIATSTDTFGKATGPLIAFMEIMSQGMEDRASTGAMQKFVQRHKEDVAKFARTFMPTIVMRLHALANLGR